MSIDAAIRQRIAEHARWAARKRTRARAAERRGKAVRAGLVAAGIDPDQALIGAFAIAVALGIRPRTLRKWRSENRLGLAGVVLQGAPQGPVFASRGRVLEIRAALQSEQGARAPREPPQRPLQATGARAMLISALQAAEGPLTATEIADRCPNVDATRSVRPELNRLLEMGALSRERSGRTATRGPRCVWRYSIGDPCIVASVLERGRRSRAAAERTMDSGTPATAGTSGTGHGCGKST